MKWLLLLAVSIVCMSMYVIGQIPLDMDGGGLNWAIGFNETVNVIFALAVIALLFILGKGIYKTLKKK